MALGALNEIIVECSNPEALARFWQALIGGEVEVEGRDWAALDGDELDFYLVFQRGSSGSAGSISLSVEVDDLAAAVDEAEMLGARKVGQVVDDDEDGQTQAMADPGGNPFRIVSG